MTTLDDMKSDVAHARVLLEHVERKMAELDKPEPAPKVNWQPVRRGEDAQYVVTGTGGTYYFSNLSNAELMDYVAQGRAFDNRAAAERFRDREVLIHELRGMPGTRRFEHGGNNAYFYYSHPTNKWVTSYFSGAELPGIIYFDTRDQAQAAIDHFGDRLDLLREPE